MTARKHSRLRLYNWTVFSLLAGSAAWAQPTADESQVSEVVVTAQRRSEPLQNVPISVQVVSGQAIADQNYNSLETLSETVPSVHVQAGGSSSKIFIRGIGSGEAQQAVEQSVGLFVDDMYFGRSRSTTTTFLDLDRIEVLKGPQSTFFGGNAIAGALNVVTRKPTNEFDASARLLYGQDQQYAAEGALNIPITATLAARVAVTANGIGGWIHNVATDKDAPDENHLAGRVSLAFTPNDDFDALLKVEASEDRETGDLHLQIANCPPPAPFTPGLFCATAVSLGLPAYPAGHLGDFEAEEPGQGTHISNTLFELTANWHHWGQTFTSVSGFYNYHYSQNLDLTGTPEYLATTEAPEQYHQFSQELRLTSPQNQPVEYLAGLYFQTDSLSYQQNVGFPFLNTPIEGAPPPFTGLVPYLPIGEAFDYDQIGHSYAIFGSATWNATDQLKISGGLRGTWVNKSMTRDFYYATAAVPFGAFVPLPASVAALPAALLGTPPGLLQGSRQDKAWLPSARVQYQLTPDAMAYFSYSRGFKAGGFNGSDTTGVLSNMPFDPEHVNAYEIGLKSEWFDHRVLLNLDVFRSNYSNLQVNVLQGYAQGNGVAVVKNAAQSRAQGVEFEGQWVPNRAFRLTANITYLDSRYVSYANAAPSSIDQLEGKPVQDLSGQPTLFAPDWSGSLIGTYTLSLPGDFKLITEFSPYFTSQYQILASNDAPTEQSGYVRLDARVGVESPDGRWALDVIGKNLSDRQILSYATIYPTSIGSYLMAREEGRNVAVQLRYHW